MGFGPYYEGLTIENTFGSKDPANVYLGFSLTSIAQAGICTEPNQSCYRRVGISNNLTNFPVANLGYKTNALPLLFETPQTAWGQVLDFVFFNSLTCAATLANILAYGSLVTPANIGPGRLVVFRPYSIRVGFVLEV